MKNGIVNAVVLISIGVILYLGSVIYERASEACPDVAIYVRCIK